MTVKDLLKVLYEKACQQKLWGLVRHTAGMLGKRVEDLAKAVTDLLVRQKQVIAFITNYMSRVFHEKLIDPKLDKKCKGNLKDPILIQLITVHSLCKTHCYLILISMARCSKWLFF